MQNTLGQINSAFTSCPFFYLLNGDGLTLSEFHAFVETRAFKRSRKWILGFLFVALQQYGAHSILLYETD